MHKTIYFAGGCFWGVEKYLAALRFVPLDQMEREGYGDLVPLVR